MSCETGFVYSTVISLEGPVLNRGVHLAAPPRHVLRGGLLHVSELFRLPQLLLVLLRAFMYICTACVPGAPPPADDERSTANKDGGGRIRAGGVIWVCDGREGAHALGHVLWEAAEDDA